MRDEMIKLLDEVALLKEMPENKLLRGQIGTIVERFSDTEFEVEFSDNKGKTIAMLTLTTDEIMLLHNQMAHA
jgi:Domain of unknown function (DUF4926)